MQVALQIALIGEKRAVNRHISAETCMIGSTRLFNDRVIVCLALVLM